MRAMVVLIFVWGTLVSTTPGIVDRYFANSAQFGQRTAASNILVVNAAVDPGLAQRASFVRPACRADDAGMPTAHMQPAVYWSGERGVEPCR
jgi:hypothetical protein